MAESNPLRRQVIDPRNGLRWAPGCGPLLAPPPVAIGCDIGQKSDPSAIAVVEAIPHEVEEQRSHFQVRALERLPLGTPYPQVARRIVAVVLAVQERDIRAAAGLSVDERLPSRFIEVSLDITGVGAPVGDLIRDELAGLGVAFVPVTFRHGERIDIKGRGKNREVAVGKAFLVSRLQSLLQTRRITLPANHPETAALLRELENYEIKVREQDGMETFGAFRTGAHDDMVTALGLAVVSDPGPVNTGPSAWIIA